MKRTLCAWLPNFPLQVFRRERPELKGKSCALFQRTHRGAFLTACSREAVYERIVPGLPLAEARSLQPDAVYAEHDVVSETSQLRESRRVVAEEMFRQDEIKHVLNIRHGNARLGNVRAENDLALMRMHRVEDALLLIVAH